MNKAHQHFLASVALLMLTAVIGCGEAAAQAQVSGAVTYDGQPVNQGEIVFMPTDPNKPSVGGRIENGKFQCVVPLGAAKVSITAFREIPGKIDRSNPGQEAPMMEMYIPGKYNTNSTLEANIGGTSGPLDFVLANG